jgi:glycogen(starch) synthase
MRILFLTNFFPPPELGGYEQDCATVASAFAARGHHVDVLTSTEGSGAAPPNGVTLHRDLQLYLSEHNLLRPPLLRRVALERSNQRSLHRALTSARPDVVSVWNMGAMSQGLLSAVADTRTPVVFVVFNDWLVWGVDQDAWMSMWRGRRTGRAVAAVVGLPTRLPDLDAMGRFCFISDATRTRAREHTSWRFPRSDVIPSGIDDRLFTRSGTASRRRTWDGQLLYVGRIDREKGIETILRSLERLPDTVLKVVGGGDPRYRSELEDLAEQLGVAGRVRWTGPVRRAALPTIYAKADALVFPSRWEEPFGLVPLEAMACGTPVVATSTGGSGDYLSHDENALVFARDDATELAEQLERLAGSPELRDRVTAGGIATAARFPIGSLVSSLEAIHLAEAGRG